MMDSKDLHIDNFHFETRHNYHEDDLTTSILFNYHHYLIYKQITFAYQDKYD